MSPSPRVVGILIARLDSSRLPGKALRPIHGRPLLGYAIERARKASDLAALALATTQRTVDDPLVAFAKAQGLPVYRGSVDDVADRVLGCAEQLGATHFVRINGDSPFLEPELIKQGIRIAVEQDMDVVTTLLERTFPYGVSLELVRCAFMRALLPAFDAEDREHVTRHFYRFPGHGRMYSLTRTPSLFGEERLVVDTEADLALFERVVARLGARTASASYQEILQLYAECR